MSIIKHQTLLAKDKIIFDLIEIMKIITTNSISNTILKVRLREPKDRLTNSWLAYTF